VAALSRGAATFAAATAAVLSGGGSALADPGAPATPEGVRAQVQALYAQAEVAGQRYDGAIEQETELQQRATLLQQHIATEQQHVNDVTAGMGALATAQYRQGGGMDPLMELMFSSDPAQYLERATTLDQADSSEAAVLTSLEGEERQLTQDRAEALDELSRLEQVRAALLSTLTPEQRNQLDQDDNDAAEQAAQAAGVALPGDQGPASSGAAAALAAARSEIGKPYVYGATGPSAFDCSGLMYWSWRHAGVALPRTSQGQAYAGRRVAVSDARPGDLVIYYGDMHHVGMYAGNGMVIHAPYPGARVRYERMADMPVAAVVRV
jgi:cell wall-associated NlpC family hydrolase